MSVEDDNLKKVTEAYVLMRREAVGENLHHIFKQQYWRLCEVLEGTYWAPYAGRRSLEKQAALYDQGRSPASKARGERVVTNAKAGDSAHNWGCASDWAEFRPEFVRTEIWDKAEWSVFGDAVRKVGLEWGGDWKRFLDRPHAQLPLQVSWKKIGEIYRAEGIEAALMMIEDESRF